MTKTDMTQGFTMTRALNATPQRSGMRGPIPMQWPDGGTLATSTP